jgi:hypothetical protein
MEGLGDVVIGAEVKALGLVGRRPLGGEQDHRDRSLFAELPHDLDPVEVRHHDVEEDDVRADLLGLREGVLASGRGDDPEPLLAQRDRDELRDPRLVISDEDQRLSSHATPPGINLDALGDGAAATVEPGARPFGWPPPPRRD